MPATVSLNFMPAFYHKHTGVTYGEAYYFDPAYRADVERIEGRFLYDTLGRFGVGSADPAPSPSLAIQPVDLIMLTQGATLHCPEDATLEAWGTPWAGLSSAEIARIDPGAAAHHPLIETLLEQYRELERIYGAQADIMGIKDGLMCTHTPYTTAHQLYGEELFFLLLDDPEAATILLEKVWAIYRAVFGRLAAALGAPPPARVHLGDCSASLLSEPVYREVVLPMNQAIARQFTGVSYHSCGASTHLLADFARIPHVRTIDLGPGTDLRAAVQQLPGVTMHPLIDPLLMRDGTPDAVEGLIRDVITAAAPAPETVLCAWSFDRETPLGNVETLYRTVEAMRHAPIQRTEDT